MRRSLRDMIADALERLAYGDDQTPDHAPHDHGDRALPITDCVGLAILYAVPCDDGTAVLILGWPATETAPELAICSITSQRTDAYFGLEIG